MTAHENVIADRRPIAVVDRDCRVLGFEPPLDELLAALRTRRVAPSEHSPHMQMLQEIRAIGIDRSDRDRLRGLTRASLEPVVRRIYERAGFRIVSPHPAEATGELPPPDLTTIREFGPVDVAVLDFVRRNREGLIRYAPGCVDVARVVGQLALAFPGARLVAVTDRREEGLRFARRLRAYVGRVSAVDARSYLDEEPRVAVSTFIGLAELEVEKADIIVLLQPRQVVGQRAELAIQCADRARIIGLLPFGTPLSPLEEDMMRFLTGFAELAVPAHGKVVRPVEVLHSDLWGGPRRQVRTVVDALRSYVWRDPVRSRRVARLAKLIERGDMGTLRSQFPAIGDAVAARSTPSRNVVVICDSLEHLRLQAQRLPSWLRVPNVDQTPSHRGATTEAASRRRDDSFGVVTTRDAVAGGQLDISDMDVAINAGANPHPPVIPPDALAVDPADARPLLLIDFRDRRHPLLRRWSRERAERYAANEWFEAGVDPVEARVDRFIAERTSR